MAGSCSSATLSSFGRCLAFTSLCFRAPSSEAEGRCPRISRNITSSKEHSLAKSSILYPRYVNPMSFFPTVLTALLSAKTPTRPFLISDSLMVVRWWCQVGVKHARRHKEEVEVQEPNGLLIVHSFGLSVCRCLVDFVVDLGVDVSSFPRLDPKALSALMAWGAPAHLLEYLAFSRCHLGRRQHRIESEIPLYRTTRKEGEWGEIHFSKKKRHWENE